jgi:hypothetical protein
MGTEALMSEAATLSYSPFDFDDSWSVERYATKHSAYGATSLYQLGGMGSLDSTTSAYGHVVLDRVFAPHFAKLDAVLQDSTLWVEDAPAPGRIAVERARIVLRELALMSMPPSKIVATAEGGVAICFSKNAKYSDIEFFNNGTILGVTSNRKERPVVWNIAARETEFAQACARIREFLDA